jgi:UDP-glucose 4-epimerase
MKKAVVFGGSGFLGRYVVEELVCRGYSVIIADAKKPDFELQNSKFIACDILDYKGLNKIVDKSISHVYNFAGFADINESIHEPRKTLELNVLGNANILDVCRDKNLERFVYASSAYACSNRGSFYGISKLASEQVVEEYGTRYQLKFSIIRYGSLYGEYANHHNGLYRMLRAALEHGEIKHKGTGEEVREYIHARDAASLSVDIIEDSQFEDSYLMLTGSERLKQKDLLTMIKEILDDKTKITYHHSEYQGHYFVTPYSFAPKVAKKLTANPYINLGQGIVACLAKIHDELENESQS